MTEAEARNAIIKLFLAEFPLLHPTIPIAVAGKEFTKPELPNPWVRISVNFNLGNQDTQGQPGNRKFTRMGMAFVQVFTAKDKGTDLSDQIVNNSLNILDGVRLERLWLYNGSPVTLPEEPDYYRQNATVEFRFENIR